MTFALSCSTIFGNCPYRPLHLSSLRYQCLGLVNPDGETDTCFALRRPVPNLSPCARRAHGDTEHIVEANETRAPRPSAVGLD